MNTSSSFEHGLECLQASLPSPITNGDFADRLKESEPITYVDIKSAELRDILRMIFQGVWLVCLREEMPSVGYMHIILSLELATD
jgi:hypothetical protein